MFCDRSTARMDPISSAPHTGVRSGAIRWARIHEFRVVGRTSVSAASGDAWRGELADTGQHLTLSISHFPAHALPKTFRFQSLCHIGVKHAVLAYVV
jgi:hypothetical protein